MKIAFIKSKKATLSSGFLANVGETGQISNLLEDLKGIQNIGDTILPQR